MSTETTVPAVEKAPGYAWVVMGLNWARTLFGSILVFGIGILLKGMMQELSFGPAQAGYLSSASWILTAILTIPMTVWASKFSAKLLLTVSIFATAIAYLGQGWAPSYGILFAIRAIAVIVSMAATPALTLLKQQWFPLRQMATVNGIENALGTVGQVIATALTPLLMLWLGGWRGVHYALGAYMLLMGVLWVLFGRENLTETYKARMATQIESPFKALAKYRPIWLLSLGWPGTTLVWIAFFTFWPTFAVETLGIPMTAAGPILSLLPFGSIVASLTSGIISDKIGLRKPLIWIPGFLLPLGYFGMLQTSSVPLLSILSFITGFLAYVFVPPGFTIPYEMPGIKPREVAVGLGLMMSFITLGGALGPIIAGNIYQAVGSIYTALAICCLSPITMGLAGLFLPETGRRAREAAAKAGAGQ